MEEDHRSAGLPDRHIEISGVRQPLGQLHQLVVVRREHSLAADPVVQMLGDRPGDGHAVISGGAAPDFIEQHQRSLGGAVQNRAGLAHLHHEGGLSARQIVGGPDACEQPVDRADARRVAGHEAAQLGQDDAQPDLAEDGALPGHVGAGHQLDARGGIEAHVVRHERFARHQALEHRVAGGDELDLEAVGHVGPHVAIGNRRLREAGPDVEPREDPRGLLHARDRRSDPPAQLREELGLALGDALLRPEDFGFVFPELRRHESLGGGQGLPALVVERHLGGVSMGDLEVIPEDLVVADLERGNPGALPFALLHRGDELLPTLPQGTALVELGIVAGANDPAVGQQSGGPFGQAGGERGGQVVQEIQLGVQLVEQ